MRREKNESAQNSEGKSLKGMMFFTASSGENEVRFSEKLQKPQKVSSWFAVVGKFPRTPTGFVLRAVSALLFFLFCFVFIYLFSFFLFQNSNPFFRWSKLGQEDLNFRPFGRGYIGMLTLAPKLKPLKKFKLNPKLL